MTIQENSGWDLSGEHLKKQLDLSWEALWTHFYSPATHLLYDNLPSLEKGHELDFCPTPAEVADCEPNVCGWGTEMADSATAGGIMLAMICDRYAVAGEPEMSGAAGKIFSGLKGCATVHHVPGFVARSICPGDGKSVYPNSSRDQYTHFIHGLWKFYHSPLADAETRTEIRKLIADTACFMEEHVTAENGYRAAMPDGKPSPAVCEMWGLDQLYPQEAARLPMIYAAAWDVTGERRFHDLCGRYLLPALEYSCKTPIAPGNAFTLLQMACSLELLRKTMPEVRNCVELIDGAMRTAAVCARYNVENAVGMFERKNGNLPRFIDWRLVERTRCCGLSIPSQAAHHIQPERDTGMAALVQLMVPKYPFPERQERLLKEAIARPALERIPTVGSLPLQAAYWKMRLRAAGGV